MKHKNKGLQELGETRIIQLIDDLIFQRTKRKLIRDDAFYFNIMKNEERKKNQPLTLCLNSDMLVSSTDIPNQMDYRQMGRKAVIMNISDLIVKGVTPRGIIISFGLPITLKVLDFESMLNGILDVCIKYNLKYIGGDMNESKELIISPTVFGFPESQKMIHRTGINERDIVVANGRFGLTGVGFDLLLKRYRDKPIPSKIYKSYEKSIKSVLNPQIGREGLILAKKGVVKASIDSSDGLMKSLHELMLSNPEIGFEITIDDSLIEEEATRYSREFDIAIEDLIFRLGGEEFIHIFIMKEENFQMSQKLIKDMGGALFRIGGVIKEKRVYGLSNGKKIELKGKGYEHFK